MLWLFEYAVTWISGSEFISSAAKILGWFMGNGAFVIALLKMFDFNKMLGSPNANGAAVLGYICGFGLTSGLLALTRRPHISELLRQVLNNRELEVLLLMLRYSLSSEDAGRRLKMSQEEVEEAFESAIRGLSKRGNSVIALMAKKDRKLPMPRSIESGQQSAQIRPTGALRLDFLTASAIALKRFRLFLRSLVSRTP